VVCRGARTDGVSDFCYDAVPLAAPISVKILHGAEAQAGWSRSRGRGVRIPMMAFR
jgi:hypothetical protein